ncbi:hypothetical protein CDAR_476021 [Caerostris darwini]|uniref:Uncharacterized protein n=1 Tax=Caerostris darwini TaxID=1538125 RepID=A0AAV4P8V2_9ARAC|nr:hypothetical protein CDAR_476021 [Caerostris darwini]
MAHGSKNSFFFSTMQVEDPIDSTFCRLHSEEHTVLQFLAALQLELLREKSEEEDNGIESSFLFPSFDFLDSAIIASYVVGKKGKIKIK